MEKTLEMKVKALDEATGVFERIKLSAKEMAAEERSSGGAALERLLKGGGALALASFAAEEMKRFGDASAEAFTKYREGALSGYDATEKVIETIPILGNFVSAAQSMVNAIGAIFSNYQEGVEKMKAGLQTEASLVEMLDQELREGAVLNAKAQDAEAEAIARVNAEYEKKFQAAEKLASRPGLSESDKALARGAADAIEAAAASNRDKAIADIQADAAKRKEEQEKRASEEKKRKAREDFKFEYDIDRAQFDREREAHHKAQEQATEDADRRAGLDKELADEQARTREAQTEAQAAALEASGHHLDAELLQIKARYHAEREEIQATLQDKLKALKPEDAGYAQKFKDAAAAQLAALGGEERADLLKATAGDHKQGGSADLPHLESTRFLTGVSQAARERNYGADSGQQTVAKLGSIEAKLAEVLAHLPGLPANIGAAITSI